MNKFSVLMMAGSLIVASAMMVRADPLIVAPTTNPTARQSDIVIPPNDTNAERTIVHMATDPTLMPAPVAPAVSVDNTVVPATPQAATSTETTVVNGQPVTTTTVEAPNLPATVIAPAPVAAPATAIPAIPARPAPVVPVVPVPAAPVVHTPAQAVPVPVMAPVIPEPVQAKSAVTILPNTTVNVQTEPAPFDAITGKPVEAGPVSGKPQESLRDKVRAQLKN